MIIYIVEDKLSVTAWSNKFSVGWPQILKYVVISLLTFSVSIIVMRLGGIHSNFKIRTMMRYPPSWFAVLVVLIFFSVRILKQKSAIAFGIDVLPFLAAGCIGILLTFITDIFSRASYSSLLKSQKESTTSYSRSGIFNSDEELLTWILEERPIISPHEDIFGLTAPATKITRLLLKKSISSIGILGPHGSGKSSLINLVEYYISHRDEIRCNLSAESELYSGQVICCHIDGWGLTSGFVAQRMLHLAIEEMKSHVDCMSIIGLPENYRNALTGTSSWGGAFISALIQTSYDPVVQLVKLDDILTA